MSWRCEVVLLERNSLLLIRLRQPVTYLVEFTAIVGGYGWFLRQGREVSYSSILNQNLSVRRRRLYEFPKLRVEVGNWIGDGTPEPMLEGVVGRVVRLVRSPRCSARRLRKYCGQQRVARW